MLPWIELDRAIVPEGGEITLMRRGTDYSIMAGTNELMSSRLSGSEEQLAALSALRLAGRRRPRVLIGGLGMGFTLTRALADFPGDAEITVAEIVPAVIDWARGPLAAIHGNSLDDPRTRLVTADVGDAITQGAPWDAILLDVDNGPDGLSRPGNDRLYGAAGLSRAYAALTSGGHLAVWSARPDPKFSRRLAQAGFAVEDVPVRARRKGRGARHLIWFATRG